ncbi:hypothetical protein [Phyllobacterium myrsinacearum]|uniref:Uncharacterized protein n=1 Tax=Phyllobacterium myrsinacearum TaxID=28101 RepID=A0A839F017_9HYPH|nr:hypothetical protein [Phyllobacterium myrsinacearum]MBA8882020.1 hypothetical protein [Phyllobacterium myrsinacearum]
MNIWNNIGLLEKVNLVRFSKLMSLATKRTINDSGQSSFAIEIVAESSEKQRITIHCGGVVDIKFGNPAETADILINIFDVRDWQREGVRYRVTEEENAAFSFNCAEFSVELE